MFKKFARSPYFKAALTILICGALLIIFNGWVAKSKLSIGFEVINKTLMPIYIGVLCSFLLCPIYNKVVKSAYRYLAGKTAVPVAAGPRMLPLVIVIEKDEQEENRTCLSIARVIATVICLVVLLGTIALISYFIIPQAIQSVVELVATAPDKLAAFSIWLTENFTRFPAFTEWFNRVANVGTTQILEWLQVHVLQAENEELAATISNGIFTLVGTAVNIFVGILIMVYLLNNKDRLAAICRKLINALCTDKKRDNIYEFCSIVNETFLGFLSGRIIDGFIIGGLTYIVMIIIGIPFAPMISVLIGVTNVIPFFGPFIGAIPATLILLIQDPRQAVYFVIMILIIQQLDGNIIGPQIVGNAIGIDSFMVLISVLIGGGLFGFVGMILGVPVFAVVYIYVNKLATRSLTNKMRKTSTDDYFTLDQYGIDATKIAGRAKKQERKNDRKQARKNRNKRTEDVNNDN
ncbi:MAG: AI-2E family transporter [Firmicutes bacterium]|nr:AI-2E family transporter [Bacillota bacterium]